MRLHVLHVPAYCGHNVVTLSSNLLYPLTLVNVYTYKLIIHALITLHILDHRKNSTKNNAQWREPPRHLAIQNTSKKGNDINQKQNIHTHILLHIYTFYHIPQFQLEYIKCF
jgi:hypothetical protein